MTQQEQLRERTKQFALRVIKLYRALPSRTDAQVMGKQLLRSGTSVAANYRAASRARSRMEFAARIGVVVEEADESVLWLELIAESGVMKAERVSDLMREARELTAIFTASHETARAGRRSISRLPDSPISR